MPIEDRDWQRLDRFLWCARFMRLRSHCAQLAAGGLLRINGLRTEKPHARLRVGDVLTLALRGEVLVIEVLALAARRGPAPEARTLYCVLEENAASCGTGETAAYRAV